MSSNFALMALRFILVVAILVAFAKCAHAMETCRLHFNDIGTIVGTGNNKLEAHSDAAMNCFSAYNELSLRLHGVSLKDEDSGLIVIDACVNAKCEK